MTAATRECKRCKQHKAAREFTPHGAICFSCKRASSEQAAERAREKHRIYQRWARRTRTQAEGTLRPKTRMCPLCRTEQPLSHFDHGMAQPECKPKRPYKQGTTRRRKSELHAPQETVSRRSRPVERGEHAGRRRDVPAAY